MDRKEFIKNIAQFRKEIGLKVEDCYVSHGGSCLMLGLRKETSDIDLTVYDEKILERLIKMGYPSKELPPKPGLSKFVVVEYKYNIDVHLSDKTKDEMKFILDMKDGVYFVNAEQTLEDKLMLNRPKDQEDIKNLKKLIEKKKREKMWY